MKVNKLNLFYLNFSQRHKEKETETLHLKDMEKCSSEREMDLMEPYTETHVEEEVNKEINNKSI